MKMILTNKVNDTSQMSDHPHITLDKYISYEYHPSIRFLNRASYAKNIKTPKQFAQSRLKIIPSTKKKKRKRLN